MEKRTWCYCLQPAAFEMKCDKCDGTNITWSEYAHMIWCYDCKIDTPGFEGVFGGPIPMGAAEMFGLSFARVNMKRNRIEYPRLVGHKIKFYAKPPKDYRGPTFELKPRTTSIPAKQINEAAAELTRRRTDGDEVAQRQAGEALLREDERSERGVACDKRLADVGMQYPSGLLEHQDRQREP